METLKITVTRQPGRCHDIVVDVVPKSFWGTNLYKNERHFISSHSFVITSANYLLQAHPRVAHFTFPDKPMKSKTRIGDSPKDRWFLEYLELAIEEFNVAQDEKRITLINNLYKED